MVDRENQNDTTAAAGLPLEPAPVSPDEVDFESPASRPPSTGRIARNTLWNLAGLCAPMAVALFAIPILLDGLGKERFGLLSLVWMLVGYFSVFDLGLGRALTKTVAERLGRGRAEEVAGVFWTACTMMFVLGAAGGLIVYALAPWLAGHALNIDPALQPETLRSFRAVAFGLPVIITTAGLVGTLEACHRFPLVNAIRVPAGAFTFVGPLLVLPFSRELYPIVLVLLAGRVVQWMVFLASCLRVVPGLRARRAFSRRDLPGLLGFGGWVTVSNVIMPLMVHIDRFLIGALRTVGEVAYYVTSAEVVIKLLILPRAWVSALFPTFAAHFHSRTDETSAIYAQSVRLLLVPLFPAVLLIVIFAPEGLGLWLGPEFAAHSAPVMRWLTTGLFLYSLAFVPTALLQGIGRPELAAWVHAIELPLYLGLAWHMIGRFGIEGAAMAWLLRAGFDAVCMFALALRQAPASRRDVLRLGVMAALALALLALAVQPRHLPTKVLCGAGELATFAVLCWFWFFAEDDRRIALKWVRKLARRSA